MSDEPFEATFVLTRKPLPPQPPDFVCACCDRLVTPSRWGRTHIAPVCANCECHWGARGRPSGITRGDYYTLNRLQAIVKRLEWEIINGRRRWSS